MTKMLLLARGTLAKRWGADKQAPRALVVEDRPAGPNLPPERANPVLHAWFFGAFRQRGCLRRWAKLDSIMDCVAPESVVPARLPWDFHPSLTEERLRLCARLLANARRDALALAAYDMGDDSWSVGCRAYAFGKQRLRRVADAGGHAWLTVLDDSHHFVFLIDQVPVRFYRGLADDPTVRTLRRQEAEARQLGLALGDDAAEGLAFRLAVETNGQGGVERVVFLALRGEGGNAECAWPIPLETPAIPGVAAVQLRLLADDGFGESERATLDLGRALPRKRAGKTRRIA
ncbi:hypothetical protein [Acidisphaera sp. L21]|jgi:hypothetical protein|uniref:hypothetical protein n=1 Tax=Acidisphaera sp. L21 TaxID=1641851 RepID=UPI00131C2673|nr:hypothetical protein [Acidisphaera sp. L21]